MTSTQPTSRKSFQTCIDVRFGHVDPAGIVYFPRIFDYVHDVFEELWNDYMDQRYYKMILEQRVGWPLVHSEVNFENPLHFGDKPCVTVTCFKLGRASLGLCYRFHVGDTLCVEAKMTTVCVELDTMKPLAIPSDFRAKLEKLVEPTAPDSTRVPS